MTAIPGWRQSALFDERDRAIIDYAEQVTKNSNGVTDAQLAALRKHFSDPQIVELTMVTAMANMTNRINNSLKTDLEF